MLNRIIPMAQIDAFTDALFRGNPAAVCLLKKPLDEITMLHIAAENNLSETAFVVLANNGIDIRWFTPKCEMDLCGHATLAAAHYLFEEGIVSGTSLTFQYRISGQLQITISQHGYTMNFPAEIVQEVSIDPEISNALGKSPLRAFKGKSKLLYRYEHQKDIEALSPNFYALEKMIAPGIIVTAPGEKHDFVSRFFATYVGIPEDPVTGSAHCALTWYWANELGKTTFHAKQLSARQGEIQCEFQGVRVLLTGKAKTYLKGEIYI